MLVVKTYSLLSKYPGADPEASNLYNNDISAWKR